MKNSLKHFVRLFVFLSVAVVCLTAVKVSAFVRDGDGVGGRIEKAIAVDPNSDDSLKAVHLKYAETVKALKKKSLFTPPEPEKKNPVKQVDGIIGQSALIGGKLYKKGDKIGDAQIVSVAPDAIVILWNEKEKRITPFDHFVAPPVVKKAKKESKPKPAEKTVVVQEPERRPPPRMERRGPGGMSPEQRQKMMEMRAKMRAKMGQGKGGGGGG